MRFSHQCVLNLKQRSENHAWHSWITCKTACGFATTLVLTEKAGPEVIKGPGANLVTVSGNNAVGVFQVGSTGDDGETATISGLTISRGQSPFGGGISNNGTLTLFNQPCIG